MKKHYLSALVLVTIATLTACNDDDNSTTLTTPTTNSQNPTTPPHHATTPIPQTTQHTNGNYRLDTSANTKDKLLEQLNNLAKEGYALVSPTTEGLLSYQSNHTTHVEYQADNQMTSDINILNNWGKQGYLYKMPAYDNNYQMFNLYVKNTSNNRTYTYQTVENLTTADHFLTHNNNLGKSGWRYHSQIFDNSIKNLYVKDNNNTTYEYATEPVDNNLTKFREKLNHRAKDGWVYRGNLSFGTTIVSLFERSNHTQSFHCEVVEMNNNKVDINLMNSYAEKGYISFGKNVIESKSTEIFCNNLNNVWQPLSGVIFP